MTTVERYRITYRDPETLEEIVVDDDYETTGHVTALMWAEDRAYMLADKGEYQLTEITSKSK